MTFKLKPTYKIIQESPLAGCLGNIEDELENNKTALNTLMGTVIPDDDKRDPTKVPALPEMSLHIVRFGPDDDLQGPHKQDEIYYIYEGNACITFGKTGEEGTGGRTIKVKTGDLIFIPAATQHNFHDFEKTDAGEDGSIVTLVFFAPNYTGSAGEEYAD